jgi:hypothetical protein
MAFVVMWCFFNVDFCKYNDNNPWCGLPRGTANLRVSGTRAMRVDLGIYTRVMKLHHQITVRT